MRTKYGTEYIRSHPHCPFLTRSQILCFHLPNAGRSSDLPVLYRFLTVLRTPDSGLLCAMPYAAMPIIFCSMQRTSTVSMICSYDLRIRSEFYAGVT